MNHNSPTFVASLIKELDSTKFNKEVYDKTGLFVVRNAIPKGLMDEWKGEWDAFYDKALADSDVTTNKSYQVGAPTKPVALRAPLPEKLAYLYKNDHILDVAEQVFGKHIAILNHRFIIKYKSKPGTSQIVASIDASTVSSHVAMFLHHDYCYHVGYHNKASFFVPITYSGKKNGTVTFYPGTHKYGYLGDVGEIDPSQFEDAWPEVTPELEPGDFAIMHSLLWHRSCANEDGTERIVADIIYQPADDPSGRQLARGEWQTDVFVRHENRTNYLKTSRVKTIAELREKLRARE